MDYLRYDIMKISGRKYFCHLLGGNREFKIAVQKILENVMSSNVYFLNKSRRNIASIKSLFVNVESREWTKK